MELHCQRYLHRHLKRYIHIYRIISFLLFLNAITNYFIFTMVNKRKTTKVEIRNFNEKSMFKFEEIIDYFKSLQNKSRYDVKDTDDCKSGKFTRTVQKYNCTKQFKAASFGDFPCKPLFGSLFHDVINKRQLPIITLFTSWSSQEDKYHIHNNTVKNWASLKPFVRPVLFTNDTYLANYCKKNGWFVLPIIKTAADGVPILKYMFLEIFKQFDSTFYGFVNSDILFTWTMVNTLHSILTSHITRITKPVIIMGQRTNVEEKCIKEVTNWETIEVIADIRGTLFHLSAQDYFITNKVFPWKSIPEVVIGRIAYDNWIMIHSTQKGYQMIDTTKTLVAIHQTTKYGNIEGFSHPQMDYNVKLLASLFGNINYMGGAMTCASFYTSYNTTGHVEVKERKTGSYCASPEYIPDLLPVEKFKEIRKRWKSA